MAELTPGQWAQARQLFERALELPPVARPGFLNRECSDPELRREVDSLLEHTGGELPAASQAIAAVAAAVALEHDPDQWLIGSRLGAYRVEAIAGHGGMGAVYRAERDDAEYRQRVAIKLVRAAASSPATLSRFKQERQILARLSHPYIARLLDGGSTPEGVPYLVMEFIEGKPITDWCRARSLNVENRLRLFLQVCEGVEHAHQHLIVHRDLKPANILVTHDGTPKLLDFGIAKLLDAGGQDQAATQTGLHLMTPDYASPEQVRGDPITPAVDTYALGLILYELLTGEKAQKIPEYTPATIARVICQTEAPAPASLRPQLSGDLDNIIRMALRKEPERRYASAGDFASDLRRYLEGHPVAARPDTLAYRWAKFVRRNRIAVAAGLAVLASLAAGFIFSLAARRGAEKRLPHVLQVTQLTQIGNVEIGGPVVTDGARVYFTQRNGGIWSLAQVPVEGGVTRPLPLTQPLARPEILDLSPDRSTLLLEAGIENNQDEAQLWLLPTTGGSPHPLPNLIAHAGTWSRDGSRIIFARGLALYQADRDGSHCRKLLDVPGSADGIRSAPAPLPRVLRFHLDTPQKKSALWEVTAEGRGLHPLLPGWRDGAETHNERDGIWTASGKYYFFQSWHGPTAGIWVIPSVDRSPIQLYSTPMDFEYLAASPDSKRIFFAAGQDRREMMRFEPKLRRFGPYLPGIAGRFVDYSRDGRWMAYVTFREGMLWRSRPDGTAATPLTPPHLYAVLPRWSPDGTGIAFTGQQPGHPDVAYVISSTGGAPREIPSTSYIEGTPSWSPDGKSLAYACVPFAGAQVQPGIWVVDLSTQTRKLLAGSEQFTRPAWSPDGRYIVAERDRAQLVLFDTQTRQWTPLAGGAGLGVPYWSHDGSYVYYQEAFAGLDQPISRVRIATRKVESLMGLKQIPESNVTGYFFGGLGPDDTPVASVIRTNSDVYSLDLDLP